MPHVDTDTQVKLNTTEKQVGKMGEACFLFAQVALDHYNANPSWTAIHEIRVMLRTPYHHEATHSAIRLKMGHMSKADIEAAADLAFFEFYRLVGAAYEDIKIIENGNVFANAKIPKVKLNVVDNQATEQTQEPVSALQGAGEDSQSRG